ncbi:hypothetical protein D0815_24345 [Vibrio parahaemolyticus]|nr:hypothetical protein [Vibrio parahaemolyticus]
MNISEVDFGIGPLQDVEDAIYIGIRKLVERNRANPGFDGLWMKEYSEVLYGSLFVSAQAYCIGSLRDINDVRKNLESIELKKEHAYKAHHIVSETYSLIELVNSTANYFKHKDEWKDLWPSNYTTQVLEAFAMDREFPINEVHDLICENHGYGCISKLVSEWRENLMASAKKEKS